LGPTLPVSWRLGCLASACVDLAISPASCARGSTMRSAPRRTELKVPAVRNMPPQRETPPPAASLAGGGNGLMEARSRHGDAAPPPGAGRASSPRRQACDILIHQVWLLDLLVPIDCSLSPLFMRCIRFMDAAAGRRGGGRGKVRGGGQWWGV
jgi:hypothetical protein